MSVRCANISAARAIATSQYSRDLDHAVYVDTYGDYFRFRPGGTLTPVDGVVVNTSDGLGQLERMGVPNRVFHRAAYWTIDPVSGSDENKGWGATQADADLAPIKTLAELDRRLAGHPGFTGKVWFKIKGDIPASDSRVMRNISGAAESPVGKPIFFGDLGTPLTTGTMTSYTAAVPGSNTGYTMALTSAASYIGKIVIDQDGSFAYVLAAASANVAIISPPMVEQHGSILTPVSAEPGDFTNGKTFSVYSLYKLPGHPFRSDVMYSYVIRLNVGDGVVSTFDNPNLGGSVAKYNSCIISCGAAGGNGTSGSWTGGFPLWTGCLFYAASAGSGTGIGFVGHHGIFHADTALNVRMFFMNGSAIRFQERLHLYNSYVNCDETSAVGGVTGSTPRLEIGIFATTATVFSGGTVRLPSDGGVIYGGVGSTNTGTLFAIPQGAAWSAPKAGCTATTSGTVISVGGTSKVFSDIPFVNTTNNASISDGP